MSPALIVFFVSYNSNGSERTPAKCCVLFMMLFTFNDFYILLVPSAS